MKGFLDPLTLLVRGDEEGVLGGGWPRGTAGKLLD